MGWHTARTLLPPPPPRGACTCRVRSNGRRRPLVVVVAATPNYLRQASPDRGKFRFKIKWLEKKCIFQNFDQNKVHFNQNHDRNQVHFNRVNQKQVPPQVPRTWQGGHGCAGRGTTGVPPSASESSAGEVVALGLNRSLFFCKSSLLRINQRHHSLRTRLGTHHLRHKIRFKIKCLEKELN